MADYGELLKRVEKKGIKIGSKIVIDDDERYIYTVKNLYQSKDELDRNVILAYISADIGSESWNALSKRLKLYKEVSNE